MANTKNTLLTPQSTKPIVNRLPPKNPGFSHFSKPNFNNNLLKFSTTFRTQNRGGGGK